MSIELHSMQNILGSALLLLLLSQSALSNVVGSDTQNFNTITSGLDFVTVQSSETLKPGIINFGLFFNYAVNTLPYFEANPQNRSSFNDSLLASDLNFGVGLLKNWDMGISFPAVLSQSVANTSTAGGQFNSYGSTEVRPNTKIRLIGDDSKGIALVASANFNRIQNNPYTGINGGPTYNLEVAGDNTFGPIAVGLNLGYRFRNPGQQIQGIPIQPIQNQVIYSAAANYLIQQTDTKVIFEIFGSQAADTTNTDQTRTQNSLEAILGIKHDFTTQLAFHFGAGSEISHAIASPDWRVYTGLNWTIGPFWGKGDSLQSQPIPEATIKQVVKKQDKFVAHDILFEFNSDVLTGEYDKTLAELVTFLHQPPEFTKVLVEGHTDSVGSEAYNLNLSQRRANAIKNYLVEHFQVPESKVEAQGFGSSKPIADNGNYQGRQLNRRVEFTIDR
jgi:outer membrane protein OmpA-like peptidoglycan-associated protein